MSVSAERSSEPDVAPPVTWCQALEAEYAALYGEPALPDGGPSDPHERLRAVHERMHDRAPSALCLSGGGIRSATFALGVLQGLAHVGVLGAFDYLSTVSGGGYTGGWFTAWLQRAGAGRPGCGAPRDRSRPGAPARGRPTPPRIIAARAAPADVPLPRAARRHSSRPTFGPSLVDDGAQSPAQLDGAPAADRRRPARSPRLLRRRPRVEQGTGPGPLVVGAFPPRRGFS